MTSVHNQLIADKNQANIAKAAQERTNKTTDTNKSSVGSQDFLYLLTLQLQYQDPMNPMDNSQMLAQEAQFSTLEQMEALTSNFSKFSTMYQANSLLGQKVEVTVEGKTTSGTVDFVDFSDKSGASVNIGGKAYPLSAVTKVYPDGATEEETAYKNFFVEAAVNIANNIADIAKKFSSYIGAEDTPNTDTPDTDTGNTDDTTKQG